MSLEHCDDCTVPPGTRCESAPGNCPYVRAKPAAIAQRFRFSEFDKRGIQLGVICARLQKLREWIGIVEYEMNLLSEHPEVAAWFDEDGVPVLPLEEDQPLDVADCCETLEEARGVIRRMTSRIEDLEDEINVLRHESIGSPRSK